MILSKTNINLYSDYKPAYFDFCLQKHPFVHFVTSSNEHLLSFMLEIFGTENFFNYQQSQIVNHYDFVALHGMWRIFVKG